MRASVFGWPRSVLPAWGEPARPGFPPEGETGKGALQNSLLPQAIFGPVLVVQIRPGSLPSSGLVQRLRAAWMRSPHNICRWFSACFQPCTASHF